MYYVAPNKIFFLTFFIYIHYRKIVLIDIGQENPSRSWPKNSHGQHQYKKYPSLMSKKNGWCHPKKKISLILNKKARVNIGRKNPGQRWLKLNLANICQITVLTKSNEKTMFGISWKKTWPMSAKKKTRLKIVLVYVCRKLPSVEVNLKQPRLTSVELVIILESIMNF